MNDREMRALLKEIMDDLESRPSQVARAPHRRPAGRVLAAALATGIGATGMGALGLGAAGLLGAASCTGAAAGQGAKTPVTRAADPGDDAHRGPPPGQARRPGAEPPRQAVDPGPVAEYAVVHPDPPDPGPQPEYAAPPPDPDPDPGPQPEYAAPDSDH